MNDNTNINSLHKFEEDIRIKSLANIHKHDEMNECLNVINSSLNITYELSNNYHAADDNELIIQKLAIDTFYAISSSLKLGLSGYYKTAYSNIRYIFETSTLMDYFNSEPNDIKEWFNANKKLRKEKFSNFKLRLYLDKRDENTEGKRRKQYELYCEYAAHPTSKGFLLLSENKNVSNGPFYKYEYLGNYLYDLARESGYSATCFSTYFVNLKNQNKLMIEDDLKNLQDWFKVNFNLS